MNDELGSDHISALFALMGAAREISNNELEELAGFRIDGKLRAALNGQKLVVSNRTGNGPFVHSLTDDGWERCREELAGGRHKASKFVAGAFFMTLDGVGRHLLRENTTLKQLFLGREPAQAPAEPVTDTTITTLYRQLAEKQGDWVRLADLRPRLNGAAYADVDRVLKTMSRAGRAHLAPKPDRNSVTAADREAAVRIGGEDNHLLVVERS